MNKLLNSTDGRFESMKDRHKVIDSAIDDAYDASALIDLVTFSHAHLSPCGEGVQVKISAASSRALELANSMLDEIIGVLECEENRLAHAMDTGGENLVVPIVGSVK